MASSCLQPRISGLCHGWNRLPLGSKSNRLSEGCSWSLSLAAFSSGAPAMLTRSPTPGLEVDQVPRWCQQGKQVEGFSAWQAAFLPSEGLTFPRPSSRSHAHQLHSTGMGRVDGVHHSMTKNWTFQKPVPSWATHRTECSVAAGGAAAVAVALDPGSPQTIKRANVFQTSKPPGSDSAVALALTDVYGSCFPLPKEQSQVPGVFQLF